MIMLLKLRSAEWNIQDDMNISKASVSLPSLSAMEVLVPRSSTHPIWQTLGLRTQNSLTNAHPHSLGHKHSGMPQWQMELAVRKRDSLTGWSAQPAVVRYGPRCWFKWKTTNVFLSSSLYFSGYSLEVTDRRVLFYFRPPIHPGADPRGIFIECSCFPRILILD